MTDTTALLEKITGKPVHPDLKATGKVKAYAWARVSTDMQEQRGDSIKQQLREIHTYADRHDIEVVEEFREAASAFTGNGKRPEFDRMVGKAKADPDITMIIVHDFSRFSRDSIKGRELFRDLRSQEINVKSVSDPDLDPETAAGLYVEAFTFAKNEAYSREISFHTKKGCRANLRMRDPESGWCFKNGAPALWGYKLHHVEYGLARGGRSSFKSIWVLNDKVVAGKPVHEWVRHCLVELAMKGVSIAKLRDFCNEKGIPGRKDDIWNSTSWKDLLYDYNILKYAGYAVWNVRGAGKRRKPVDEWEVVEDAHPAIITKEEAYALIDVRQELRKKYRGPVGGRARNSKFLLSGGSAVCSRCGKNLIGHKDYYVCGSEPYRSGLGCGEGVYVPQLLLESEVIKDIKDIISKLSDPKRFTKKVNAELQRLWEQHSGYDPDAEKQIKKIDRKIHHIREQLEGGLDDVEYFNGRLRELKSEREALESSLAACDKPLQVDVAKVMAYRTNLDNILKRAAPTERKEYVQAWIDRITLDPDARELFIQYRIPDELTNLPVMNTSSPGTHCPGCYTQ